MQLSYEILCYFFVLAFTAFIFNFHYTNFEAINELNGNNSYDYHKKLSVLIETSSQKSNVSKDKTNISYIDSDSEVLLLNSTLDYDWIDQLLLSLNNEKLLKQNVLSKLEVWKSIPNSMIHRYSYYYTGNSTIINYSYNNTDVTENECRRKEIEFNQQRQYSLKCRMSISFTKAFSIQPKALFYLGWVAYWNMEAKALAGGPQGEFVVWADLAVSMAAIGYEITFIHTIYEFWQIIGYNKVNYDVIITDYDGLGTAEETGDFPKNHCKYYIVDYFGTDSEYNKLRNLDLKHILTPYPYDNINSFISFIINPEVISSNKSELHNIKYNKSMGVLWAKNKFHYYQSSIDTIKWVTEYSKLHTFFIHDDIIIKDDMNKFIHHGYTTKIDFWNILSKSSFLLGIGEPLDGPTALEAIAQGCSYINPIFNPSKHIKGHPNNRKYTSQHLYIEKYFKPPYAYTIDIYNQTILQNTIKEIINRKIKLSSYINPMNTFNYIIPNIRSIFDQQSICLSNDIYHHNDNIINKNKPRKHPNNQVWYSYQQAYNNYQNKLKLQEKNKQNFQQHRNNKLKYKSKYKTRNKENLRFQ